MQHCIPFCLVICHCQQYKYTECCFGNATRHSLCTDEPYVTANNLKCWVLSWKANNGFPMYFCQDTKYVILSTIHVKCRIFIPILVFGLDHQIISLQYQTSRKSVQCKPSIHLDRGSRQRHMKKLTGAFHKYGNAPIHRVGPLTLQPPSPGTSTCTRGLSAIHMQ